MCGVPGDIPEQPAIDRQCATAIPGACGVPLLSAAAFAIARHDRRSLTVEQLTACRIAYEAGAAFAEFAERHVMSDASMRTLLLAVGVQSRPRGQILNVVLDDAGQASAPTRSR